MGILKPKCVCSDGTALWGFTSATRTDSKRGGFDSSFILFKSNDNPVDMDSMTWSVVSTVEEKNLYILGQGVCMADKGVFIYFTDRASGPGLTSGQQSFPGGLLYDPSLPPNPGANVTGVGGWKMIDGDYKWSSSAGSLLFPVRSPTGTTELIHVYWAEFNLRQYALSFGKFNPTTAKFEVRTTWGSMYGPSGYLKSIGSVAYSDNTLILVNNVPSPEVVAIPFRNGSLPLTPPPMSDVEMHNATSLVPCTGNFARNVLSGVVGNTFFLICQNSTTIRTVPTEVSVLATFDIKVPTSDLTYQAQLSSPVGSSLSMVPIGDKSPWAFIHDSMGDMYGLPLSGPTIGKWMRPSFKLNVTEGWEDWSILSQKLPPPSEGKKSSATGAIVGGIIGALAVVGAVIYFCCHRRAAKMAKLEAQMLQHGLGPGKTTAGTVDSIQGHQDHIVRPEPQVFLSGKQQLAQPQKLPFEQANPSSGPSFNGIIPVEQHQQPLPMMQQSTQLPQQHQFQFSSHPQPNFVTTVSDNGSSNPVSVSQTGIALPIWEPQPFSPPVPASNVGLPLPSATNPTAANAAYNQSLGSAAECSSIVATATHHSGPRPTMANVHVP